MGILRKIYQSTIAAPVRSLFFSDLIVNTRNFDDVMWLGHPIWQNVLDLWTIQEIIARVRPALILETGTNRGGSSYFYANLFDLMQTDGRIITVDVQKLHDLSHPRVQYVIGSSVAPETMSIMTDAAKNAQGPVMVILDSDHSAPHVLRELQLYAPLVTSGSYCLVQDGVIDTIRTLRSGRPGPLVSIEQFLQTTTDFEVDQKLCDRFLITQHPKGWLRRK
ncbi:MAG: CmcI family methyltransferase [Pirellulales bacterium]